jgi:acetyltransferase-like isoleucine patch superfamily enzyme
MERAASSAEPVAAPPTEVPPEIRGAPPPRRGGLLTLLRFMRRKRMLNLKYGRLMARLGLRKLHHGRKLVLDGLAFIGPGCAIQIGRDGRIELGRWCWVGHACKLRCHEGVISIGAKTVMGQECTISAYQHVSIGRECVIADRVMLIDFDHGMVDVEQPIRLQGIYKRDVRVGNNVWIGYGACILRGVSVGDNAVIGTNAVVTRDVPANAVIAGVPARVIRMREEPRGLRWE